MRWLQYLWHYEWDWRDDSRGHFTAPSRDVLSLVQYDRLRAGLPILYLALTVISVAAALVAAGDLLPALQYGFPGILFIVSIVRLFIWWRRREEAPDPEAAREALSRTFALSIVMISATSFWAVSGFDHGKGEQGLMMPLFMALGSVASASCLAALPRAAIAVLIIGLGPISLDMIALGSPEFVATGTSLVVVAGVQARLIIDQFAGMTRAINLNAELSNRADTDALTGLPNRRAFQRHLDRAVASGSHFVLAMLDLDGFKPVNDTHGHAVGDQLLQAVGARLAAGCREQDIVARLGGDEFAIVLRSLSGEASVAAWCERVRQHVSQPYPLAGRTVTISVSIGIAAFPGQAATAAELMEAADANLYRAKAMRYANIASISARARR